MIILMINQKRYSTTKCVAFKILLIKIITLFLINIINKIAKKLLKLLKNLVMSNVLISLLSKSQWTNHKYQ